MLMPNKKLIVKINFDFEKVLVASLYDCDIKILIIAGINFFLYTPSTENNFCTILFFVKLPLKKLRI